jgi:hypothetical protein
VRSLAGVNLDAGIRKHAQRPARTSNGERFLRLEGRMGRERRAFDIVDDFPFMLRSWEHSEPFSKACQELNLSRFSLPILP